MNPLIETHGLAKEFARGDIRVLALRGVSVSIQRGEFVAIVGKSGSGKSTFMNILGCLDRPSEGKFVLEGQDVAGLSKDERAELRGQKIGFVFQAFNLIPRTSAQENVELPLIYSGVSRAEQARRAQESLERLGLRDRSEHHPSQLSGGEQQRVAIARALVNHPQLLLADEPTGNLDTRTSLEIMKILMQLNRAEGLTVILVTHEPEIAAFADRVLTFKDGEIVSDEPGLSGEGVLPASLPEEKEAKEA
ncbi:MAG: ABC transporter ATP-binding protein [Myxococcota bacterium]|jgi:putative ABC transport system ATP-binding protein|nr:ABC transporter ATP-binding protein [Myxococcota bacterium]